MAEVTLTFCDIEGVGYSEVAITRRLHRSGESEYFINKKSVRLKDIIDFFFGFGGEAKTLSPYSNRAKSIRSSTTRLWSGAISLKTQPRILRFLIRKKEAIRKLEQVDLNLSRVKDIHSEVEKQIELLEQQSVKAKEFNQKKGEFERLEKGILAGKWHLNSQKLVEIEKAGAALDCEGLNLFLNEQRELLKGVKGSLDELRVMLGEKMQGMNDFKREIALVDQKLQTNKARLLEISQNVKKWSLSVEEMGKISLQRVKKKRS